MTYRPKRQGFERLCDTSKCISKQELQCVNCSICQTRGQHCSRDTINIFTLLLPTCIREDLHSSNRAAGARNCFSSLVGIGLEDMTPGDYRVIISDHWCGKVGVYETWSADVGSVLGALTCLIEAIAVCGIDQSFRYGREAGPALSMRSTKTGEHKGTYALRRREDPLIPSSEGLICTSPYCLYSHQLVIRV